MTIVPAVEGGAAGAKWIIHGGHVLFCRVPPPSIASRIVGFNPRMCGCHKQYDDPARQLFEKSRGLFDVALPVAGSGGHSENAFSEETASWDRGRLARIRERTGRRPAVPGKAGQFS